MNSEIFYCKKCGRILTSEESIKLGYGKTCYKAIQFHQIQYKTNELIELKNLYNQLSLKFSILEKKVNKIESSSNSSRENIERIKLDKCITELNDFQKDFGLVIQELKSIFNIKDFSHRKILKPIINKEN